MANIVELISIRLTYPGSPEKEVFGVSENKKSVWALLWGVLLSPGETFERMLAEERPPFLAAAFLFTGIGLVLALLLLPKMQAYSLWMLQNSPQITPEQLAAARPLIAVSVAVSLIIGALAGPWLYWLAVAGVLKLYDTLFTGKGARFGALFAVAVYGYLPIQLAAIIALPLMLVTAVENIPWTSVSLAALLPAQKTYLYFFLARCNPFTWWSLALWGIGWAKCAKARPNGILIFLFVLWLLLSLGMAAYALSKAGAIPG